MTSTAYSVVQETFYKSWKGDASGYISRCNSTTPCIPQVIVEAAEAYRKLGIELNTVDCDAKTLRRLFGCGGFYGINIHIDAVRTQALVAIGKNLLEIHALRPELRETSINSSGEERESPILDDDKVRCIEWLIYVVEEL